MLTAWGDESGSDPTKDPGTYLIGAALIDEADVAHVRVVMSQLKLSIEPKLHWHGSSDDRRFELVDTVVQLPIVGVVVAHNQVGAKDRRGRRKCLEYLLPNLANMPCSTITFESRGTQDESDLDLLQKMRSARVIGTGLRVEHRVGRTEPALWVADVACGAVVQARVGNREYLERLGGAIDVIEL